MSAPLHLAIVMPTCQLFRSCLESSDSFWFRDPIYQSMRWPGFQFVRRPGFVGHLTVRIPGHRGSCRARPSLEVRAPEPLATASRLPLPASVLGLPAHHCGHTHEFAHSVRRVGRSWDMAREGWLECLLRAVISSIDRASRCYRAEQECPN